MIHEFMGYPWSVWQPNIQIGTWPSAVPSPEHARFLQLLWSRSPSDTAPAPLVATYASDIFQLGVLIHEVICATSVLAGRPGTYVLHTLASMAPVDLLACSVPWRKQDLNLLLHLARALMHKDPLQRGSARRAVAVLQKMALPVRGHEGPRQVVVPECEVLDCCFTVKHKP